MQGSYLTICVVILALGALAGAKKTVGGFWRTMLGAAIFAEIVYFLLTAGSPSQG